MRHSPISTAILAFVLSTGSHCTLASEYSVQPREGRWEVTSRTETAPPQVTRACFSKQDMRQLHVVATGTAHCEIRNYHPAANGAAWTVHCTAPAAIDGNGAIEFAGPDTYRGMLHLRMKTVSGEDIRIENRFSAQRLGDC